MMRKKKGSLSLSMNAIVILILAITLLGLGLSFMRGLFKQMEAKVGVAVDIQELTNPPTTDNPITLSPSKLNLREGDDTEVIVAFMNVLASDANCGLNLCQSGKGTGSCDSATNGLCTGDGGDSCTLNIVYNKNSLTLKKDQINSYAVAIHVPSGTVGSGLTSKTLLYTAKMCCDASTTPDADCLDSGDGMFTKDLVVVVKP